MDWNEWKYRSYRWVQWWQQWPARQWVNRHPKQVIGVAVASGLVFLIVVISLVVGGGEQADPTASKRAWFYDLNTGKLFAASATKAPPIRAPSGPTPEGENAGVRAYVVTYGTGDNQSEPMVAYLETRAPGIDAGAYHQAHRQVGPDWGKGLLVRRVEDAEWVAADDPAGRAIIERAYQPDQQGRMPQPYLP